MAFEFLLALKRASLPRMSNETYKKRQKELARLQKRQEKAARRLQRKAEKIKGGPPLEGESLPPTKN